MNSQYKQKVADAIENAIEQSRMPVNDVEYNVGWDATKQCVVGSIYTEYRGDKFGASLSATQQLPADIIESQAASILREICSKTRDIIPFDGRDIHEKSRGSVYRCGECGTDITIYDAVEGLGNTPLAEHELLSNIERHVDVLQLYLIGHLHENCSCNTERFK